MFSEMTSSVEWMPEGKSKYS